MADATKGLTANIGNGLDPNYSVNCSYVVNTVELRARGYNVVAKPLPDRYKGNGRTSREIQEDWLKADGTPPAFSFSKGGQRAIEAEVKDWPDGGRGVVIIQWKGGGAHVFNVEYKGGKVRYYEGQVESADAAAYFANRKPGSYMGLLRLDDLQPTDKLSDNVYPATSPEAARIGKLAAARRDEIAAAKASAQARIDAMRKAKLDAIPLADRIAEQERRLEKYARFFGKDDPGYPELEASVRRNIEQLK
jgi:hypothetical protein